MAWPPKKKVKIAFQKWMEGNDNEAGRLFSRRWAYLMSYAMLESRSTMGYVWSNAERC